MVQNPSNLNLESQAQARGPPNLNPKPQTLNLRLKREDSTSKHWAYVNVCRFIEAYDAPHKIILQVYVALLRAFQPENRPLLKQALDILTPALPKRLPPAEHKYPIWIRYTKKIIVEEGHSLPHLIHIWHFLVRHSDLFYSSRAQFVPQMVNSLNRIGETINPKDPNKPYLEIKPH
jgi:transformation/transcription domain-associated protein